MSEQPREDTNYLAYTQEDWRGLLLNLGEKPFHQDS